MSFVPVQGASGIVPLLMTGPVKRKARKPKTRVVKKVVYRTAKKPKAGSVTALKAKLKHQHAGSDAFMHTLRQIKVAKGLACKVG